MEACEPSSLLRAFAQNLREMSDDDEDCASSCFRVRACVRAQLKASWQLGHCEQTESLTLFNVEM